MCTATKEINGTTDDIDEYPYNGKRAVGYRMPPNALVGRTDGEGESL